MNIYPQDSFQRFEFDKLRSLIAEQCRSASAKEFALEIQPIKDFSEMLLQLEQTKEFLNTLDGIVHFPRSSFVDIQKEIALLKVSNSTLVEKQIFLIRDISDTGNQIIQYLSDKKQIFPAISQIFNETYFTNDILDAIDKVLDNAGLVKSSASKQLSTIRKDLFEARRDLDRVFRSHMSKYRKLGWLTDIEETVYNGRRVLSVFAEQKRSVKGIIQGSSETGKTSFIEPIETVDLNNDVFDLELQERREILRILQELTRQLRVYLPLIEAYQKALSWLDFTRAKALLAKKMNATLPFVVKKPEINLIHAKHPLLFLQNQSLSKDVIPFSCKLSSEKRIMVISGPNAGGKSITLKTIGLIQLMLQSGILVPVDERSEIGVFRQLFTDIGDNQSIEYELSTYSSRLQKMKYFLEFADSKTLVLIDEFGTGTDPELGGAMAEVILEELNNKKSIGVVTTHYTNIKLAAEQLNGTFNACMLFDDKTLKPLYQLLIGQPGSSYTFVIAEKSGLARDVIERAKDKIDTDKVKLDQLLRQLQSERQKAKNEANKYTEQFSLSKEKQLKYEELYDKWKAKIENSQANNESNQKYIQAGKKFIQLMNEWEKSKDKKEFSKYLTKLFTAEKKKKIENKMTASKNKKKEIDIEQIKQDLKVGSRVKLLNGKQIGVVEEILNNKARVAFGAIKSLCGLENLQLVNE